MHVARLHLAIKTDAIEHDAHNGAVVRRSGVIVALDVRVIVIRRGVASAAIHEQLRQRILFSTRLEERLLARSHVHTTWAVAVVLCSVKAGVRRPRIGRGTSVRRRTEARFERAVDVLSVGRIADIAKRWRRGWSSVAGDARRANGARKLARVCIVHHL